MTEEERRGYMVNKIMQQPFNKLTRDEARQCVDIGQVAVENALVAIKAQCALAPNPLDATINALKTLEGNLEMVLDTVIAKKAEQITIQELGISLGGDTMMSNTCDCPNCTTARKLVESGEARIIAEGDGFMLLDISKDTAQ